MHRWSRGSGDRVNFISAEECCTTQVPLTLNTSLEHWLLSQNLIIFLKFSLIFWLHWIAVYCGCPSIDMILHWCEWAVLLDMNLQHATDLANSDCAVIVNVTTLLIYHLDHLHDSSSLFLWSQCCAHMLLAIMANHVFWWTGLCWSIWWLQTRMPSLHCDLWNVNLEKLVPIRPALVLAQNLEQDTGWSGAHQVWFKTCLQHTKQLTNSWNPALALRDSSGTHWSVAGKSGACTTKGLSLLNWSCNKVHECSLDGGHWSSRLRSYGGVVCCFYLLGVAVGFKVHYLHRDQQRRNQRCQPIMRTVGPM